MEEETKKKHENMEKKKKKEHWNQKIKVNNKMNI